MSTSINLVLRAEANADGKHSILVRIIHNRTVSSITLNHLSVYKQDWDESLMQVKKTGKYIPQRELLNNRLMDVRSQLQKLVFKLEDEGVLNKITAKEIRQLFLNKPTTSTISDYIDNLIRYYNDIGQHGNAAIYKQCQSFLGRYAKNSITFEQLTQETLQRIQTNYLSKGYSPNGLSVYLRTLKAIYNHAVKNGVAKAENYPFKGFDIPKQNTLKVYVNRSDIALIAGYAIEVETTAWHCRNLWLFMYYCSGMSIADLARLKPSNLNNGHLTYIRTKTKRKKQDTPIVLKVPEPALLILEHYIADKGEYIFPIIKHTNMPEKHRTDIHNYAKLIKKHMNRIAQALNIQANITPGIARHSWANAAREVTQDKKLIQQALGHSSIKTTEIYMGSFSNNEIDNLVDLISKT
jgi:integrase/recombinase XerD